MVVPGPDGNIPLGKILREAAGYDARSDVTELAPTRGRVAADADAPQREDTYVGNGSEWLNVAHEVGVDLAGLPGVRLVRTADDLPDPEGGEHALVDGVTYLLADLITSDAAIRLGENTAIIGWHGSTSGFVYSGEEGAAIRATDVGVFMRDVYAHAPGADLFDVSADTETEFLVESCAFSDVPGLPFPTFGAMGSLGYINGYRVPSFKSCSFGDFEGGLTLAGESEKIFFDGCPFRRVADDGVRILTFDETFDTEVVDMPDNYFKNGRDDTEVIFVDPDAVISEVFQYRGNTHDPSFAADNILNGAARLDDEPYRVRDSFPLRDSRAFIDYTLDAGTVTVTITTEATDKFDGAAYEPVGGPTTVPASETGSRFVHDGDGSTTYEGSRDNVVNLDAYVALGTGTSDVVAAGWFKNGELLERTAIRIQMNQQGGGVAKALSPIGIVRNMSNGDVFDLRVANLGSTEDIDVGELNGRLST